ncbi:hypothetical protein LCGC14_0622180 [marine sediment metagenome]|uniref:Fibronectin type-III domain-containing protein n=1 Tax=marine sediment metagenome TaxID=412755 RepID=A0A0F9RNS9_9ZZZZ
MALPAPTGITITSLGSTAVSIAWGFSPANQGQIAGFKVTLDGNVVASRSKSLRVYGYSSLTANHFNYVVGVYAYKSGQSDSAEVTTGTGTYQLCLKPGAGTVEFTVTGDDWTRNIEWTAGGPHDGSFQYEWGIDELGRTGFVAGTFATVLIEELPANTQITPWVRAINSSGEATEKVTGNPITTTSATAPADLVGTISSRSSSTMTLGWTGTTDQLKRVGATVDGSTLYMWPHNSNVTFVALTPDTDQNVSMVAETDGTISQPTEGDYTDVDDPPGVHLSASDELQLGDTFNPVTTNYTITAFGGFNESGTKSSLDGTVVTWNRATYPLMLITIEANGVNGSARSVVYPFYAPDALHDYSMANGFVEIVDDYQNNRETPAEMLLEAFGRRCPWTNFAGDDINIVLEKLRSPLSVMAIAAVRADPGYQKITYMEYTLQQFGFDLLIIETLQRVFRTIPEGSVCVENTVLISQGG